MNQADSTVLKTVSNFGFTAQRVDTLTASEYTIVGIAMDVSGSVQPYESDLEKAYRDIIGACRKNPRADNLLVRLGTFNSNLSEQHGFATLDSIDESKVKFSAHGGTALYDATMEGVESIATYAKQLGGMDYLVNGLLVVIGDGMENESRTANMSKIKTFITQMRKDELIESLKVIVIGVGVDPDTSTYLKDFVCGIGADQFVSVANSGPKELAKLADFVSRSISSSSQALGSGGPSQNLAI